MIIVCSESVVMFGLVCAFVFGVIGAVQSSSAMISLSCAIACLSMIFFINEEFIEAK